MMCERALSRETPGQLLADKQFVQGYIADSYAQLVQFRLFVLYTAWSIDKHNDYRKVRKDIAAIKVVMPGVLHDIAWRAMQVHGALGVTNEMPFHSDDAGRRRDGARRRSDRGAQGDRRPPGAARLPAQRRPVADPAPPEASRRGPRPSSPTTSSTKWGTCDRHSERLAAWMDDQGLGVGAPIEHRFISGGTQNEIYEIRRGDVHGAMRIPPPTAPETRDDGILREWRIIEALDGTDVPHTAAIAVCDDTGRARAAPSTSWASSTAGRRWAPTGGRQPFDTDLEARKGLAFQLVEGIALLSKVDWQAKGLADLGHPDGFHERQVDRWTAFLERIKGRELPGFDEASAWLRAHRPLDFIPGLMHGDYQFANVMYRHGAPGPPGRHRRLGDGHRRRPQARPGLGRARRGPRNRRGRRAIVGYVDMTGMPLAVGGPRALLRGVGPPGRRHRLLRACWPSGSWPSCWSRAIQRAGRRRDAPGLRADRPRPDAGRGRAGRDSDYQA